MDQSRPRVAHITTVDVSLRYLLLNQMRSLQDAGYEVAGISAPGREVPVVEAAGIRHIAVPLSRSYSPWRDLVALVQLWRILRRERFTIVHTHTPKGGLLGQYAALMAGTPIRVHTIHGLYVPNGASSLVRKVFLQLERLTMRFSHLNLSQNPEDITTAIDQRLSRPERIRLLGNGIDVSRFDPDRRSPAEVALLRSRLGLRPEHVVIGTVARFVAEKGYRELLAAAQRVHARYPEVRFIWIGGEEPEKRDGLRASIISEAGLGGIVQHLGHRDDVADLYAAMDLFVLPSYREGFPRASMEAAASGLASVVTEIRGCRQTVEHGRTGYRVPAADADALAAAIEELLANPERRADFGRAARAKALAEFDERVVFQRVRDAYAELLPRLAAVKAPSALRST